MHSSLLSGKNVIIQGITGAHGRFHAAAMKANGTNVVGGTSPNKSGELVDGIPVFGSIDELHDEISVDISVIFVPAAYAKDAIMEAITAKIPLIVCITEGIPIHDMLQINQQLEKGSSVLIGPNSPGILVPGGNKLGIIPAHLSLPGSTAVVSRSGTLTYEVMDGLTRRGIGQKYIVGIGGDRIQGGSFIDCLKMFEDDADVKDIVMIGEIGGSSELNAADFIESNIKKPVHAYITGHHAPAGIQLGHAGAILNSTSETANAKSEYLSQRGISVYPTITKLVEGL